MVWQYTYLLVFSTLCDKINWYFQVVLFEEILTSVCYHTVCLMR